MISDPGSRKKPIPDSGAKKNTGSRIHNTTGRCFSWTTVWHGREGEEFISTKKVLLSGVPMLESVGRGGNSESLLLSLDTTVVEIRLQRKQRIWHVELTQGLQNIFYTLCGSWLCWTLQVSQVQPIRVRILLLRNVITFMFRPEIQRQAHSTNAWPTRLPGVGD